MACSSDSPSTHSTAPEVHAAGVCAREAGEHGLDLPLPGTGDQQHELVAAEARQQVARPQQRRPDAGEVDEQAVAGGVTALVVDELEVVEVDDRERERLTAAPAIARSRKAAAAKPVRLSRPVRLSVCASARSRALSRVRIATATQTIAESASQTDTPVGARAASSATPSPTIMSTLHTAARRAGRKKNAT